MSAGYVLLSWCEEQKIVAVARYRAGWSAAEGRRALCAQCVQTGPSVGVKSPRNQKQGELREKNEETRQVLGEEVDLGGERAECWAL